MSESAVSRPRRAPRVRRRPFLLALGMGIVGVLARPIAWTGADVRAVRTILESKLRIDLRSGGLFKREDGHKYTGLLITVVMLVFFGGLLSFGALVSDTLLSAGSLVSLGLMTLVVMVLLTDYSGLIINPADDLVIGVCPVDDRTLVVSQLVHLAVFMTICIAALCLCPLVVGLATLGPAWGPGLILVAGLAGALGVLVVIVLSLAVSRLVGPKRAQGAMLAIQISLMIALMASGQLLRFVDWKSFGELVSGGSWWLLALPPFWFGGLMEVVGGSVAGIHLALAACGLVGPVGALLLVLHLSVSRTRASTPEPARSHRTEDRNPVRWLGRLVCRSQVQRAAFDQCVALSTRERGFRLRAWPMLAYPIIVVLVPLLGDGGGAEAWSSYVVYGGLIYVVPLLMQARFSDTFEAGWLFEAAPLARSGDVVAGAVKALCVLYLLPWALLSAAFGWVTDGPARVLDASLGFGVLVLVTAWSAGGLLPSFPFARRFNQSEMSSQLLVIFSVTLCGAGLGVAHHFLARHPVTLALALVLTAAGAAWRLRALAARADRAF